MVTKENQRKEWLNFEAGAIAKSTDGRLVPLLFDLTFAELQGPMSQHQACESTKDGLLRLFISLNAVLPPERTLTSEDLAAAFEAFWPQIDAGFANIRGSVTAPTSSIARDMPSIIAEILEIVRELRAQVPPPVDVEGAALERDLLARIFRSVTRERNPVFSRVTESQAAEAKLEQFVDADGPEPGLRSHDPEEWPRAHRGVGVLQAAARYLTSSRSNFGIDTLGPADP